MENVPRCTFCKRYSDKIEYHHVIPRRYNTSIGVIICCHDCHQIADRLSDILIKGIFNNNINLDNLFKQVEVYNHITIDNKPNKRKIIYDSMMN